MVSAKTGYGCDEVLRAMCSMDHIGRVFVFCEAAVTSIIGDQVGEFVPEIEQHICPTRFFSSQNHPSPSTH